MIPLRTDIPIRRTPLANYIIIALNCVLYVAFDVAEVPSLQAYKDNILALQCGLPEWWQFFTYQFLHGGVWHLVGNMWFLWVFGNSVNVRFGNVSYAMFYLAGGAFAGWGFALSSQDLLIGASGSIAAITTTFMVLFPRSRILFLFVMFIITTFELPALWVILFKIVLWDNLISPSFDADMQTAYAAHLYGYLYGFVFTTALLLFRGLSRDQFDLVAIMKRWNQRRAFASSLDNPQAEARARYGTVARPITLDPQKQREVNMQLDRISELRSEINDALSGTADLQRAMATYEQLIMLDPQQFLSRPNQLEIAKAFYAHKKSPQAASAFESFLRQYGNTPEATEVALLVGIIYARDLEQFEAAEVHLNGVIDKLSDDTRRAQCQQWIDKIEETLGRQSSE